MNTDTIKQNEYYQQSIDWATNYLSKSETLVDFKCFDGIIIHDTHVTLNIWLYRLQNSNNREKHSCFYKIKKFKDFINLKNGN